MPIQQKGKKFSKPAESGKREQNNKRRSRTRDEKGRQADENSFFPGLRRLMRGEKLESEI